MVINWKETCEKCMDGEIEPRHCQYYGEPNGCNSPTYGEHPPVGNAAAMREALKKVGNAAAWIAESCNDQQTAKYMNDMIAIVQTALSAPARNCDVEYADQVEMYYAFKDWCNAKGHTIEPMLAYDAFDWLLAPAAEQKGGAE